jgi:hypothetical protein
MEHTEQQRQQQRETKQQRDTETPESTAVRPKSTPGSSTSGQTPLQFMQHRLRERFGTDILRQPEETTMQRDMPREEIVGTSSSLHEGSSAAANVRPETPEERYHRMGKAQMTETTPKNYPPSGRRRELTTPKTTMYVGAHHRHMKSPLRQSAAARTEEARQRTARRILRGA